MTREESIAHWQRGARDALESAQILLDAGKYALVLYHCQLAVEKALKASYIAIHDASPPPTHNLMQLAKALDREWSEEHLLLLDSLSDLAVLARYGDETWQQVQATEDVSKRWHSQATAFLTLLLP